MSETTPKSQHAPVDSARIDDAVRKAMREAVLMHARLGRPVCTLRAGEVVWLSPEEVFSLFVNEPAPASANSPSPAAGRLK